MEIPTPANGERSPQGMELKDAGTRSALRFHLELLGFQKLQWAVPKMGKAGARRVLVAGEPCPTMWGRGAAYGVLEHHLLAPSPRWSLCGFEGRLAVARNAGRALMRRKRKDCRQLEEPPRSPVGLQGNMEQEKTGQSLFLLLQSE